MKKVSNLKKGLIGIALGTGLVLGTAYKVNEAYNGTTMQDYIGGSNKVQIYEDGKEKELEVKVYPLWKVKPNHCSQYARLTTENLGNELEYPGNAWDLKERNENYEYSPEKLSKGDLVTFYHPNSSYNKEGRNETHVAACLDNTRGIYAEQRGMNSRITTIEEFKKEGWEPRRIIKVKKNN